jgi:hypothetical protein
MIYSSLLDIRANNKIITPNEFDFMYQAEPTIGDLAISISVDKTLLDECGESCKNDRDYLLNSEFHLLFMMLQNAINKQSKGPRLPKYLFNKVAKIDCSGSKIRLIGMGSTIHNQVV